ncbi:hypothetical protein [Sulfolobus acidocaldarius]|uniref:hypothetical protein n=1 Tax=Sulfolobus acidocaldarius TaxID=2285 RepID=UPI000B5A3724|nr:hypothetical protein [Sulfolobus acidocaldarius]
MENDLYLQGFLDSLELAIHKVSTAKSKEEALKLLLDIKEDIELRKIARIQQMLDELKTL